MSGEITQAGQSKGAKEVFPVTDADGDAEGNDVECCGAPPLLRYAVPPPGGGFFAILGPASAPDE